VIMGMPYGIFRVIHGRVQGTGRDIAGGRKCAADSKAVRPLPARAEQTVSSNHPKGCHREKKEVTPGTPGGLVTRSKPVHAR
jgi:hypothetical protein